MEIQTMIIFGLVVVAALLIPWFEGLLKNGRALMITVLLLGLAFALRGALLNYRSGDYNSFLYNWVEYFRVSGGFHGFDQSVGNYNVPYLYFLAFFSYLPLNDLYLIKLLSISFDVVAAFGMMKLAGVFTRSVSRRLAAFLATLLLPTVIINGAMWGQCDSIYTALAVLALWLVLTGRPKHSMVLMALSFGFKLQAIFILPIFVVMLFAGKIKVRELFVFPLTYILLILPAVVYGRPFMDTLLIYTTQTDSIGTGLNYNSPSIYTLITGGNTAAFSAVGITAAFFLVIALLVWSWFRRKSLSNEALLGLTLLFVVGIPLLLPHMHDRYFFLTDVLTVIPAIIYPAYFPVTLFASFSSYLCYYAYLKTAYLLPLRYGTFALFAVFLVFFTFTAERLGSGRASFHNIRNI